MLTLRAQSRVLGTVATAPAVYVAADLWGATAFSEESVLGMIGGGTVLATIFVLCLVVGYRAWKTPPELHVTALVAIAAFVLWCLLDMAFQFLASISPWYRIGRLFAMITAVWFYKVVHSRLMSRAFKHISSRVVLSTSLISAAAVVVGTSYFLDLSMSWHTLSHEPATRLFLVAAYLLVVFVFYRGAIFISSRP